jgi:hypothetical protein
MFELGKTVKPDDRVKLMPSLLSRWHVKAAHDDEMKSKIQDSEAKLKAVEAKLQETEAQLKVTSAKLENISEILVRPA